MYLSIVKYVDNINKWATKYAYVFRFVGYKTLKFF